MGKGRILIAACLLLTTTGVLLLVLKANTGLLETEPREPPKSTDLFLAVSFGEFDRVRQLLAEGVDVNERSYHGGTPLMAAPGAFADRDDILSYLVDRGADVKARDKQGRTVLHYVAANWADGLVNDLVASGADINARDKDGNTPLLYSLGGLIDPMRAVSCLPPADEQGCPLIYAAFLEAGANVSIRNKEKKTFHDYIVDKPWTQPWAARFDPANQPNR